MKKTYLITSGVLTALAVLVYLYSTQSTNNSKVMANPTTVVSSFGCNDGAMFGYVLEKNSDGSIHFRAPSKPPQMDILVVRTEIQNGYKYVGPDVTIIDAQDDLKVNLGGKDLNCRKGVNGK